jgi:hypothetical protein
MIWGSNDQHRNGLHDDIIKKEGTTPVVFIWTIFLLFFPNKKKGEKLGVFLFPSVDLSNFANFFGKVWQIFNITKLKRKTLHNTLDA